MDRNNSELESIKKQFDTLKETRLQIKQSIGKIDEIKNSIKHNYLQYISRETQYYFGLDSFHFQNKAIEMEHENMLQLYHFIDNRIYGDYYKLFLMMVTSLKSQLQPNQLDKMKELTHLSQYPVYKDLEPFKIYDFDLINQIHQDIIIVLENVHELFHENKINIEEHRQQLDLGMNIDNYVINQEYMNHHLHMSNQLHENYLSVFHKYHAEWLKKYYEKIQLFHKQIKHHTSNENRVVDVQMDTPVEIADISADVSAEIIDPPKEVSDASCNDGFQVVSKKKKNKRKKK